MTVHSPPKPFSAAVWTVGGYAAMQILRFGFNIALARMVAPKLFGVMALVNLVVQGLQMFSDLGLRQCIVQHPRGDDPEFVNTAWTLQVIRGSVLWVGTGILAYPLAEFYGESALVWLIPLAGFAAFVSGFTSSANLTYSRHLRRGPLVRREVGAYILTVILILSATWYTVHHWPAESQSWMLYALIACGAVFSAGLEVVLSYTLKPVVPPRFQLSAASRSILLSFGGWIFASTGCTFLASQADRLIVGKLSLETLGVYHIAAVLAAVPVALVGAVGTHIAFPVLSAAVRNGTPSTDAFLRSQRTILILAGWLGTGIICAGPAFIDLVYDQRYADAATFVRLLGIAAWFTMLVTPSELALLAIGRPNRLAYGQMVRLAGLCVLLPGGYAIGGVNGLILGVAGGELLRYLVVSQAASAAGFDKRSVDLGVSCFAGALIGIDLLMVNPLFDEQGPAIRFTIVTVGFTLIWAGFYFVMNLRDQRWPDAVRLRRRPRGSVTNCTWGNREGNRTKSGPTPGFTTCHDSGEL